MAKKWQKNAKKNVKNTKMPYLKGLVYNCAKWAQTAYNDSMENGTLLYDISTDCHVHVINESTRTIIAFRGTTTLTDWLHDFKILRTKVDYLNGTLVHRGFMKQYNSIREELLKLVPEGLPIICCGHSLGGALATVCALDLALQREDQVSCCTYGSPRVGNLKFAKLFNREVAVSFRCVFKKDPITFTPLPIRFRHVRGGIHFTDSGVDFEPPSTNCIGCWVTHHNMREYVGSAYKYSQESKRISVSQ